MKITETIQCSEQTGIFHIPGVHNSQTTLCGFVDVPHDALDATRFKMNCKSCRQALLRIQALSFPRGYFAPHSK
jgi:hypothetical protein